ncbi:hypothetical protein [Ruminiclostridium papyrosolvens]|uniref:Uncharacterized protein n=1 Tax=Ruminiclostridium papyrosolvens C7 TaxID=1330534 RepID=U4QYQ1_9FIRM|nr:hypothetical protein [Ruminiclostridium papyrosolvens]EPR09960.1 hypothetical protein L323_15420 [Ruminiclostridium papyrosolvens C7]
MSENKWSNKFSKCISCNTTLHPHKAKGLCNSCYQKEHKYPKSECSICGKTSRVHKIDNGKSICQKCYKQPLHTCSICNKQASAAVKLSMTEYVCDSCYIKHYRTKHICSICGKLEVLAINSSDKKVCIKCYSSPNHLCSKCGRNIESPYIVDGKHVCSRCYENSKTSSSEIDINQGVYICSICGNSGSVQHIFSDNSIICQDCAKQQVHICNSCFNPAVPIHSYSNALPYCRNCYYKQKFESIFDKLAMNWCENFTNIIKDYFNSKAEKVSYESVWVQVNTSKNLLDDVYSNYVNNSSDFSSIDFSIIHQKHFTKKLFIIDMISFLCHKNIMPDYDCSLFLLENLSYQISNLAVEFQKVIKAYKESLLIKYRNYQQKGWIKNHSKFRYYTCYLYMLTALRFLYFCHVLLNLIQPTEINNQTIDAYLRLKPYDKGNLRHFITYINKHKITFTQLNLPNSKYRHELNVSLCTDKQKQLLKSCLYNKNIKLRDRIIVILMLLYGFTPEEIRILKKSNFAQTILSNKTINILCFNKTSHEIPEILSPLILEYLDTLRTDSEYAFPGRNYNTAISLSLVCRIVHDFDVTATELYYTAINNAMLNGLHQPALLMKSFGINHKTATRYYKLLRGSEEFI